MRKEVVTGMVIAVLVSFAAIIYTWSGKETGNSSLSGYGITALMFGGIELLFGLLLVLFPRSRHYGAGVLCGGLITLLVGYSICSGINFKS